MANSIFLSIIVHFAEATSNCLKFVYSILHQNLKAALAGLIWIATSCDSSNDGVDIKVSINYFDRYLLHNVKNKNEKLLQYGS